MRPSRETQHPASRRPTWLRMAFNPPVRVECWGCTNVFWLDRSGTDIGSPADWTCPNCLTRQKRDQDGNILPLPEMFDGTMNEEATERIDRSHLSRYRSRNKGQDEVFCETCRGHQRVVYQLLSSYIPDEEDPNFDEFNETADSYRKQLEVRYPLACKDCGGRVKAAISQRNHQFKSRLLHSTLSKSRGDRIAPTRRTPSLFWVVCGICWISSMAALTTIQLCGIFGPNILPQLGPLDSLRYPDHIVGSLSRANITSALSKVVNHVFSQKSVSIPAKSILNISELSAFIIATLAVLSILGEAWDPREWIIMRSPHATIRERWYYPWTRMVALPLLALEFHLLFAKPPTQQSLHPLMSPYLVTLLLSCVRLAISSTAKWVQMPIQIKLSDSAETDHTTPEPALRGENDTSRHSTTRRRQMSPLDALPLLSRSASDPSNNAQEDWGRWSSKGSGSWNGPSASDIETIDWGSSRAPLPASATPFADFGTYRESASFQSTSLAPNLQQVGSDRGGSKTTLNDTKYFSRAYEPSPLANPSLINGLNIGNMSLGKMFGFPSAEIQQPENHFAHRSHSPSMDPQQDVWSYRKKSMDADLDIDANENENEDEDEDVARTKASMWRRNGPKAPTKQTQFGMGLMSMSSSSQYRGKSKFEKREDFAAQRYFPPEPETGLEENFFGVVKIVDDYLPHRERPVSFIDRSKTICKYLTVASFLVMATCRCAMQVMPNVLGLETVWRASIYCAVASSFTVLILSVAAVCAVDGTIATKKRPSRKS